MSVACHSLGQAKDCLGRHRADDKRSARHRSEVRLTGAAAARIPSGLCGIADARALNLASSIPNLFRDAASRTRDKASAWSRDARHPIETQCKSDFSSKATGSRRVRLGSELLWLRRESTCRLDAEPTIAASVRSDVSVWCLPAQPTTPAPVTVSSAEAANL